MTDIPDARITRTEVFIGGQKLPGPILDGSVRVTPGGWDGVNLVSVDFVVAEVTVEDPTAEEPA